MFAVFMFIIMMFILLSAGDPTSNNDCINWDTSYEDKNNQCHITANITSDFATDLKQALAEKESPIGKVRINFTNETKYNDSCVIQAKTWTWTRDAYGSRFLDMDPSYSIYSLGIFGLYTSKSVDIGMNSNCTLTFGTKTTTYLIVNALENLIANLTVQDKDQNVQRRWCFPVRKYIESVTYGICRYIICPVNSLAYRCCRLNKNRTNVACRMEHYSEEWWVYPASIGTYLFAYSPLLLMCLASIIHKSIAEATHWRKRTDSNTVDGKAQGQDGENVIFETTQNPLTISSTLIEFISEPLNLLSNTVSRIVRVGFIFASLSIVALDVGLHGNKSNFDFTVARIESWEPLAFLTLLVDWGRCGIYFLPALGGPVVVLVVYVVLGSLFLGTPTDLSSLLADALPDNKNIVTTPLYMDMESYERYGSPHIISRFGYNKVYMTMRAYLFMFLNPAFWCYAVYKQFERFRTHFEMLSSKVNFRVAIIVATLIFPLYTLMCVLELTMCALYYGLPILSFALFFNRAFYLAIGRALIKFDGNISKLLWIICCAFTTVVTSFLLYVFSLISVYSLLFFARIVIYTYGAIIIYPEVANSRLVLYLYAALYFTECVKGYSNVYAKLFQTTIQVCNDLQEGGTLNMDIVKHYQKCRGIPKTLFDFIIEKQCPKRVQLFITFFKLLCYFCVLLITLLLIEWFNRWNKIPSITVVITTIFIGGIPKVLSDYFTKYRSQDMELEVELKHLILKYMRENEFGQVC